MLDSSFIIELSNIPSAAVCVQAVLWMLQPRAGGDCKPGPGVRTGPGTAGPAGLQFYR